MSNTVNNDEFSDREEIDGDPQLPNLEQIYQTNNDQCFFSQSYILSRQLVQNILKKTYTTIEERSFEEKVPINSCAQVLSIMELIVISAFNQDGLQTDISNTIEDQEPIIINYDRWRRNRVNIEEGSITCSEEEDQLEELPSQPNSSKQNKQRFSVIEKKKTNIIQPPKSSSSEVRLIEFQVVEEEDDFVDKLRQKKLYDLKKKNEIEQKIKEDLVQNQKKDSSTNKYTYDYDGKILLNKGVKMDKLQPTTLKIKVDLKDVPKTQNTQSLQSLTNTKKGSKQIIQTNNQQQPSIPLPPKATAEIPNKNIVDRKDITKDVTGDKGLRLDRGAQFPYEIFTMTNGVKLIYEQRYKEGIKHQVSDSAEQLQYRLSGQNFLPGDDVSKQMQQLRLTRTEYKMLTDNGNPFQQQQQTKSQFISVDIQETVNKTTTTTEIKKQVQFNENHQVKSKFTQSPEKKQEKISMKNAKLLETMLVAQQKPETPSKPIKNGNEPITKNPVDLFNQSLLNSKDWGKTNNKISQFPPVKVSQSRGHNGSLEQLYRLPRDRINIQQQRTSSEFYKLQPRRASHKSMIFVAKFLNLYIEGFGGSQVQIYQGAVNLQKVQLKLQTLNKLLKESLIPFTILKADIEILNIDIPWSSLTTQSIKTYISGLNVIIQYNEQEDIETLIQDLGKKQNNENKISIQDEIRKHKEIDEQVLKKFVKKLLLNLSFDIRDIQVELLIKQQYRLQMVLQQFNTQCQDNLRINIEDADQFHRELKIDTFFIKLIRFNDDDISNQQLLALDQCNAYIERAKDSIHCNLEFNNLNLILDKDITIMAHDALEKQILKEQHIINKLNEFKIQPIHENFIFRDITTVSKGIQLSIFINSLFLQSSQLTLFLEQCQIQARSFLQQRFYKLSFNSINIKYNSQKLLTLQKLESNEFSIWPELHHPDEQIVIEITLNQSDRMKLIEQKVTLQIESILIDFDLQNILNNYQAIQKHIQSYQGFVQVNPKPNTQTKSMQKKLIYKMNLMKIKIIMSAFGNNQLKLLFQSNTQINLYQKKDKIKTIELKHQQLQFQLYDQYQHLLFSITGLNIILDYFKTINLNFHFMQVQLRLHKLTILQINQLQKLFLKQEKSITYNNNQQIEKQIKPIQICIQIDRCSIDFGQCMDNNYISLLTLNIKQLELKLQILDNTLDEIDLQSNLNIWTTHPLQKFSSKITNTMILKLIWNRVVKPDKIQNILQILNGIEINLSQLTISNLLNLGNLLSGLDVINIIHNKTKKNILINILCNQQTISYQLNPDSQTFLTQLYDNIQDSKDYPSLQIQVGLEINESLQLWSQLHPFHFSKQYFNKFFVFDEIDQQEHDIFLKAVNNEFVLTQQEKQIPDINIAEPIFENLSEYDITFKPANAEQIQIDGNSKQVFHTKLNEQNSISLTLNTENQQEIKFNLKEVSQYKAVLSFNFVKIDNNFYNVLLSIELIKDPKGQFIQKIIIKPFLIIINLLPWNFSIGNAQFINLPISVDVNMNNALITHFDHQLDQFYINLLDNRKYTSNSQQIIINGQVTNLQYINFLKEGKYAIEINKRHHMIMIFRNNVLVQNQMCFVICRNIYQQQIKYLLIRNQTQFYFIIMKNKSRINIFPFTDNCLEYNIQKGDKYRLFITNHEFEVMQLLDSETLTKNNLKVNKIQIQNIHLIEIMVDVQKIVGKEFKISIPNIKIDIQICKKQEININFDLNMRFFSNTHLDILIQSFILQFEGINVINIVDCFSIIEISNSTDLNLVVVNNLFFKMKEIKLNINQQFLNIIKLLISLLRLDPLFIRREIQQTNKCSWDSLIQTTFLILNLIVDPITLEINIQTVINMNNSINLPQLQIKMKKFNPNQLKSEIISFYLAFLITKIPTIQLLFQNIPNPLSLFSAKKQDIDIVKLPYFFIHHPISTRQSIIQYVILQKKCKILNQKCEIILQSDKLIIQSSTTQNIDLNQIIKMKQNKNSLTLYLEQNNKIKIMSNQCNLIGNLIKSLLY